MHLGSPLLVIFMSLTSQMWGSCLIKKYYLNFNNLETVDYLDGILLHDMKASLLNSDIGIIKIEGLAAVSSRERKKSIFVNITQSLGNIMIQNPNKHEIISCIYDEQRTKKNFAHHNGDVPFHTDGSFLPNPPEIVGIWVETEAAAGGETELVYGLKTLAESDILISLASQKFPFHIHDSYHIPGESPFIVKNIITNNTIVFRKDLMMQGIDDALPMSQNRKIMKELVCLLDSAFSKSPHTIKFAMKQDCIYFFNNQMFLHNRKSYIGNRVIWRTWIQKL